MSFNSLSWLRTRKTKFKVAVSDLGWTAADIVGLSERQFWIVFSGSESPLSGVSYSNSQFPSLS